MPRLIGARRAAMAYLRNVPINAAEALLRGLIIEIVPADELRARARALARQLASGATVAFAAMQTMLRDSWRNDLGSQFAAEARGLKFTSDSDSDNAQRAIASKRAPTFEGR